MADSLWLAIGLVFVLEGIGPLLFPNRWSDYVQKMVAEGPATLRQIGGVLVVVGLVIVATFV